MSFNLIIYSLYTFLCFNYNQFSIIWLILSELGVDVISMQWIINESTDDWNTIFDVLFSTLPHFRNNYPISITFPTDLQWLTFCNLFHVTISQLSIIWCPITVSLTFSIFQSLTRLIIRYIFLFEKEQLLIYLTPSKIFPFTAEIVLQLNSLTAISANSFRIVRSIESFY